MSLRTTTRNGSFSNVEWSNDVANISVEPIPLETAAVCEQGRWRGRQADDSSQVSGDDASRN